ncbi:MAG: type VII toxin-antitoxin system HepT family RNase toxin [Desulfuromonadaceae bacterium]
MEVKLVVDRNILVAKVTTIEKCINKVKEKRSASIDEFMVDEDSQDIVLFNLMQAIQGCVDMAAHIVSDEGYGMAGCMNDFFYLLRGRNIISVYLQEKLISAVGFRNLVVHEYAKLNLNQVYYIATHGIGDLEEFVSIVVRRFA